MHHIFDTEAENKI